MAAVTQSIPNYLGGVSKQIDQKKLPGQVRECLNALPDPTFGLMKRPGFKWVNTLTPTVTPTSAKWFYINRDDVEDYIGCITKGTPGGIDIWNAQTGVKCSLTYGTGAQAYIQAASGFTDDPHNYYDVLTVQDTSIITNKTKTVAALAAPTYVADTKATVRLLQVKYSTKYTISIKIGSTTHAAAEYITINQENLSTSGNNELVNNADKILTELKTDLEAFNFPNGTLTVKRTPATLELSYAASSGSTGMTVTATDNSGNAAIKAVGEQVNTVADLPNESIHNRIIKVVNSSGGQSADTYWTKFNAENDDIGPGSWEESVDPSVSLGLDSSTMPHELKNTSLNTFVFQKATWDPRAVGDLDTNSDPSFVGYTLQQAFFHNNRLGFLTEDNVSMSKSASFYNFYHSTALAQAEDDPIDVNCSSIRPAVLHAILPTAQGLILFSQNQQFIMFSDAKILTPTTTIIRGISNYEMDVNIDPVDVGTTINFVSKTPSYTRIFAMQTRGSEESPLIHDIGKVVSEWIPKEVNSLLASPQNQLIALYGPTSKDVYIHKMHTAGQNVIMQAWFKWQLPGKVHSLAIDSDIMTAVVDHEGIYSLISCSLTQTPETEIIVTSSGDQINPHMDMYASPVSQAKVTLVNGDTRIELPYKDISTLTPVLLIGGSGTTNFNGVTESGFTITPTRPAGQDHTTANPYFSVPNKDLTSTGSGTTYDKILIGYKYNFDVELPKTYFKLTPDGKVYDYTATLTIARMKFAVGLSSVLAFKVKSKGYSGPIKEYDGDGSTATFTTPFPLKTENEVIVKVNGTKQTLGTAYTYTSTDNQATVTFLSGHIPAGPVTANNVTKPAERIEITTGTWYDVQPVSDAGQYLADDVPLAEENLYTVPIHQRTENFNMRIFSDSPFPVALNSLMWEGNYSPRFYRRT